MRPGKWHDRVSDMKGYITTNGALVFMEPRLCYRITWKYGIVSLTHCWPIQQIWMLWTIIAIIMQMS
jgi:hypothetical protein